MKDFTLRVIVEGPIDTISVELLEGLSEPPEIRETDNIQFILTSTHAVGDPVIFLQDHPITLTLYQKNESTVEYRSELFRHLLNHFGLASIAIHFKNLNTLHHVTPINVVAKKINKEQAEKILFYLSTKMADVTKVCFSKTEVGSDSQAGENIDTLTKLNFSRKILESMSGIRNRFLAQPCKRSSEQLRITPYDDRSHITDKDIEWLFKHLDQLYPVPSDSSKLVLQNRHYSIDKIQRTVVERNTNVYENQVIYGFLINLKKFLLDIPSHFRSYKSESKYNGFFTFDSILKTIEEPLLQRRRQEASNLIRQCNDLILFFEKNLPCHNKGVVRPVLTPLSRRYPHYEKSFRMIDEWYNLGQPKWSGVNYLFGMKSLDKLYEFFCLYKLIDCLKDSGYLLQSSETRKASREHGILGYPAENSEDSLSNFYSFEQHGKTVQVFYEPTIWSFTEHSKPNELVDIFHSGSGYRSCWTPDFLIKIVKNDISSFLIFDAKYSDHLNTKNKHLPEIIEKYYLKTRALSASGSIEQPAAVKAVYAFIPKSHSDEMGIYGGPFNIGDRLASPPYFGYVKLSSDEERSFNSVVKQMVNAF